MKSLANNTVVKRLQVDDAGNAYQKATGTASLTTEEVDVLGWSGLRFMVCLGVVEALVVDPPAAAGTIAVKLQGCATQSGTYVDTVGATATTLADADDNKMVLIEVDRPLNRYYKAVITITGAGGAVDAALVELFGTNGTSSRAIDGKTKSQTLVVGV